MDITTPLREDEVLTQPTHRVVVTTSSTSQGAGDDDGKKKKKKEKSSKSKSKESGIDEAKKEKNDKKNKQKNSSAVEEDLLALDWNVTTAHNSMAVASASASGGDKIGNLLDPALMMPAPADTVTVAPVKSSLDQLVPMSSSATTSTGKKSKSHSNIGYSLLYHLGRQAEINYSAKAVDKDGREIQITWEATNLSSNASTLSATVSLASSLFIRDVQPRMLEIAKRLPSQDVSRSNSMIILQNPLTDTLILNSTLTLTVEDPAHSLLGSDSSPMTVSIPLKILVTSAFAPYKLDESSFQEKVSKSSSKWAIRSAVIQSDSKPNSAFKRIAACLQAHLVETESSKAAMMSAKTKNGCKVFILCKALGSGTVNVDVKCLGASEVESSQVAEIVLNALKTEVF